MALGSQFFKMLLMLMMPRVLKFKLALASDPVLMGEGENIVVSLPCFSNFPFPPELPPPLPPPLLLPLLLLLLLPPPTPLAPSTRAPKAADVAAALRNSSPPCLLLRGELWALPTLLAPACPGGVIAGMGVPTLAPVLMSLRARPKSPSLSVSPSIKMLTGFTSRCTRPCSWMCARAPATCDKKWVL
jgi:hypothetical protein